MIDAAAYKEFEEWFNRENAPDSDFAGDTAQSVLEWAESGGFLDDLLAWSKGGRRLDEFGSIRFSPHSDCDPFPTVRRVGGDHDRGFSPALNSEMRRRVHPDD